MISLLLALPPAHATSGFDPAAPAATFTGQETRTLDGATPLWSRIERLEDPDRQLFGAGEYNTLSEWPSAAAYAPWIGACFGTPRPHESSVLLHMGIDEANATGTPILFVHGAGDNGSRGFITMATHMNNQGRPVYAVTLPNSHGDLFQHAELVANAIARVRARTGEAQVDLVAHSKGGIAAAIYTAHTASASWGSSAYEQSGTPYRGDVRKLLLIATPLGGIDTAYRWPSSNLMGLDADLAIAPTSWQAWYPYGSVTWTVRTDLAAQDFHSDGADLFPGQRQLLARQNHPLPGSMAWLGSYAVQLDWYTTYEGGLGYWSESAGIDAAIADGGDLIARLAAQGVDPGVQLYLVAGENPLMPNGTEDFLALSFGQAWVDMATAGTDLWAALLAEAVGQSLVSVGFEQREVQGLAAGDLMLGEISGPSDGVVFLDSALRAATLTGRGAVVADRYTANLSHLDLLYASPITGGLLIAAAEADPLEDGWQGAVGERYVQADTIGWVREALADDDEPEDSGLQDSGLQDSGLEDSGLQDSGLEDSGLQDSDATETDDTGTGEGEGSPGKGNGSCSSVPARSGWGAVTLLALLLGRRQRTAFTD